MKLFSFSTLDEAIECYGRNNLIPIDNLKQIIFYTQLGLQPKCVFETEGKPGRITAWFHKGETQYAYQQWKENRPVKEVTRE